MNPNSSRPKLTGAMIATTFERGPAKRQKLELLLPDKKEVAVAVTLMKHRFELPLEGQTSPLQIEPVTTTTCSQIGSSKLHNRVHELFGDKALHPHVCEIIIPESAFPEFAYIGFDIRQLDGSAVALPSFTKEERRLPDTIHLEVHRNKFKFRKLGTPTLLLLLTRKQASERLVSIAQKYGLFDRDDEASHNMLGNLLFTVISGDDGPALTESLENGNE